MARSGKKPRKKMEALKYDVPAGGPKKKKDDDWSFEDIARSKTRRR